MSSDFTFPAQDDSIEAGGAPLVCGEYLRLLPGRRLACRARWQEKAVFAKIFRNRGVGRKEWKRECRYFDLLKQRGIDIPALLFRGISPDGSFCILITEWLEEVETLQEAWRHADKNMLMADVCRHLADQHRAGVMQHDLHADNLVYWNGRILTIDYGRVSVGKRPLQRRRSLNSLALLLVQLHPMSEELENKALQAYINRRGWVLSEHDQQGFGAIVQRNLRRIRKQAVKKLFRTCTAFSAGRSGKWVWVYDHAFLDAAKLVVLDWDAEAATAGLGTGEHNGGVVRKKISALGVTDVVGVWFDVSGGAQAWKKLKGRVPSEQAWIHAQLLHYQDVPMEYPLMHVLGSRGLLRGAGVICAKMRKGLGPNEFFLADGIPLKMKQEMAESLLSILINLRWSMISVDSIESAIRIDEDGPYLPAPYRIKVHDNRTQAAEVVAEAWISFVRNLPASLESQELFGSTGFARLMSGSA
jgi:tRNA A-37 threonylcarbamoyl transferase component Bud32